ncbi:hypothetical protein R6Q59_000226 [Mikania micrantha]
MSFRMQTLNEEEEYSWSQKDSIVRRTGRDILIAVDHGPKSKHAFDWALQHFCCAGDIVHLVHAVSSLKNSIVYQASQTLMEKLTLQALKVSKSSTLLFCDCSIQFPTFGIELGINEEQQCEDRATIKVKNMTSKGVD